MSEKLSDRLDEACAGVLIAEATGNLRIVTTAFNRLLDAAREAAAALRAVEGDAVDAERYRFLRDGPDHPCKHPCVYAFLPGDKEYPTPLGGERLDAAIDKARGVPLDAAGSAEGVG